VEESAKIFLNILQGRGTKAQNQVVIANSGMAIYCANPSMTLMQAQDKAKESLMGGGALKSFEALRKVMA
jgi:anthranilate phosphoribosyltransferase